jgi:hypothetical protein
MEWVVQVDSPIMPTVLYGKCPHTKAGNGHYGRGDSRRTRDPLSIAKSHASSVHSSPLTLLTGDASGMRLPEQHGDAREDGIPAVPPPPHVASHGGADVAQTVHIRQQPEITRRGQVSSRHNTQHIVHVQSLGQFTTPCLSRWFKCIPHYYTIEWTYSPTPPKDRPTHCMKNAYVHGPYGCITETDRQGRDSVIR